MVDNGEFQVFVNELPRYLWNALEGKYEVCIDIFQSERYGQVAVVVAKKEGELNLSNLDKWWQKYDEAAMNYNFLNFYHDFAAGVEAQKAIDAKEM